MKTSRLFPGCLLLVSLWAALLLTRPAPVGAHPLDEFYQVTFITLAPAQATMIVELYTGVLVAPRVIDMIDTNADAQLSVAEQQAYVERFTGDLIVTADDQPLSLRADHLEFPNLLDLKAGVGVIRFYLYADLPPAAGAHHFFYENNHFPEKGIYIVNALSDDPQRVQIAAQERDVYQKSVKLAYTVAAVGTANPAPAPTVEPTAVEMPAGAPGEGQKWLTGYLYEAQLSPLIIGLVLLASILLGGLHALTPGHGKTLVAAYLIGSRGTVRHAMFLGGIVTFTHTASVIVIGLLALLASQFLVPNVLVPALEILSGLLVVYIGVQLIWSRWQEYRRGEAAGDHHPHAHHHHDDHPHPHAGGHHHHHDDDHGHHHHLPENIKLQELLALGISGGLVPCPEALGIMLIAVGLNRILLGLGMVVAFSFGLAAVLIVIGILLVRAKSLLDGVSQAGQRWQMLLPLVSAIIVTLLGVGIMLKGLWPYLAAG